MLSYQNSPKRPRNLKVVKTIGLSLIGQPNQNILLDHQVMNKEGQLRQVNLFQLINWLDSILQCLNKMIKKLNKLWSRLKKDNHFQYCHLLRYMVSKKVI